MMKTTSCTGIILAGGENKRFNGNNKSFARIDGRTIFERIHHLFKQMFDEIILVTNDPLKYLDYDLAIATDHYSARSSLNGLHAGLFAASGSHAFCVACDTPFIKKELVELVVGEIRSNRDIVIPETSKGFEPLFAVYSKSCLKPMAYQLENDLLKLQGLFHRVRVKKIPEGRLREIDPELTSFFNVNTPEDLVRAEQMLGHST